MSAPEPFAVGFRDTAAAVVLAPRGALSLRTVPQLRRALDTHLADRGRVLVDLSGAQLGWKPALQVFPTALAATTGWPAARLVLFGAGARRLRGVRGLAEAVHVADTEAEAVRLLALRPPRLSRRVELACDGRAAKWARLLVEDVREDWEVADVDLRTARLLASEMVTDTVLRVRTSCLLTCTLTPRALRIAVRDSGTGAAPMPSGPGSLTSVLAATSRAWGVHWHDDGRTVWASLPRGR